VTFWTELLGAEVKYYQAGGRRTRAIEAGIGEPVIMMHGVSGHAETFVRNVIPLANAGFHVYAIDAIGHGFTEKPPDATYDAALFRGHLIDFMDAIGAKAAHLVGQSLGGWTAFDTARHHPERVLSMVSLTGAGILLEDEKDRQESEEIHERVRDVTMRAIEAPTRESVRKRLEWLMADPSRVTDELVETRYRIMMLPDSRVAMPKMVSDMTGRLNRAQMLDEQALAKLRTRTMIVWTDKNPTTPHTVGRRAAELIPNCRFEMLTDAGHWPQFEKAELLNPLLAGFLKAK
jgi:pimeloyl-ACP methyl ester carboxylesterase